MKALIAFYQLVCYLLALAGIALFMTAIAGAIFGGGIVGYDDPEIAKINHEKYFAFLNVLEWGMFGAFPLWCILSLLMMLTKSFNPNKFYVKVGILGFAICIIYILWDPFELISYLTN